MRPSEPAHFDDSLWPLLLIRLPPQTPSWRHEENLATITAYLRRGERQLHIYDLSRVEMVPSEQRQRQANWTRENESLLREVMIASALIITSPIVRLSMSIIMHFKSLPNPHIISPDLEDAVGWAAERFEQEGLSAVAQRVRERLLPPRNP